MNPARRYKSVFSRGSSGCLLQALSSHTPEVLIRYGVLMVESKPLGVAIREHHIQHFVWAIENTISLTVGSIGRIANQPWQRKRTAPGAFDTRPEVPLWLTRVWRAEGGGWRRVGEKRLALG